MLLRVAALASALLAVSSAASPQTPLQSIGDSVQHLQRLHSLVVSHRGSVVLERYYNGARATRLANVKSVSKSIISALVGIAIERKLIRGVEQPINDFFAAELKRPEDAAKRAITIGHLLSMQPGLESTSSRNYGAWVRSPNWVRYVLQRPLEDPPGRRMEYSTGNTHLLSAILHKVAGTSTWRFAQDMLARPLGFSLAQWPRDPQGIYFGGNDMLLTPRQMLAFGELYLRRGRTAAQQVIPEAWIRESWIPADDRASTTTNTATAGGCGTWRESGCITRGVTAGSSSSSCPTQSS